jgi:rubrerythrin
MEKFVHRENVKLYRKLLAETTDEQKRQMLLKLLADEEAKHAQPPEKKQD